MSLRFALLGHPVGHSMSPVIHGAAYRALGLAHRYELVDVPDEAALVRALDAVRRGEIAGANVTVPWKRETFRLADARAPSADESGAANVLVRDEGGRLIAHNTDIPALAAEIARARPGARRFVVIGSGGAALAAVQAARSLGAERVSVSARRWRASLAADAWPHAAEFRALGAEPLNWPEDSVARPFNEACALADVIVQATSAGMHGAESGASVADIVPWAELAAGTLAYDLVYNPRETAFLRRAAARGISHSDGLGMLVGQAALAFELWLGVKPPREQMLVAAEAELEARRSP
jgi:shikimate dehydrogenase